ncbi:MAG TPA: branched-chain amino acid ABC transporter permease [Actinomycetota bacterium]|nr:branched-chain amino acid ABC transporter permease [Actinomycetota bacterium]
MTTVQARQLVRSTRWPKAAAILVLIGVAAWIPQRGSTFTASLALNILIFGLLATSLDLMAGYTGLVSLGHAAFLGIGAYGIAIATNHHISPNMAIPIALAAVLLAAGILGVVAVRVRDLTFVILTLALSQLVWGLALLWVSVSGGDNGLSVNSLPVLGPFDLNTPNTLYYFVLVIFLLCETLLWAIVRSPFGLSLQGIRDNEQRMRTLGYNVSLHKYLAFVISSSLAGVAGILYAFYNLYVTPNSIDFSHNGIIVMMAIVGGLGTLWGPLVGAGVVVFIQLYVSIHVTRWVTLLGVVFVLTVLFAREGLWGTFLKLPGMLARIRQRRSSPVA